MAKIKVADAARKLGVSPETIRTRIREGTLPAQRVGPRVFVLEESDVDRLLEPPISDRAVVAAAAAGRSKR